VTIVQATSLIARTVTVLGEDPRVLGAWLTGSRGRGTDDRYSDVDLWLVVKDQQAFLADWPSIVEDISPTVLCQRMPDAPMFVNITPEWLRFDVSVAGPDEVARRPRTGMRLLFDRAGVADHLREGSAPRPPSPARVAGMTTEFIRVLGLLPVVLGRDELEVAASGASMLRTLLIQLMVEDVAVADRGGALRLRALLPPERLSALTALPPIAATRESAVAAHVACAEAFLPLARDLCARTGVAWPEELWQAARRWLRAELDVELPDSVGEPEPVHEPAS